MINDDDDGDMMRATNQDHHKHNLFSAIGIRQQESCMVKMMRNGFDVF